MEVGASPDRQSNQPFPSHLVKSERIRSIYALMKQENEGHHGKSQITKIVLIVVLVVAASPFVINRLGRMESFVGTDDQAQAMIVRIRPDYQPWFDSIFDPGEKEEWLFALQAAIGVGVFSYCLIKLHARRKKRDRSQGK